MGNYYYAQIDNDGVCCSILQLSGIVENSDLIQINSYDTSVLGKIWSNGEWINNPNPAEPRPEPVTLEKLQERIGQLEQQNMALMMGMVDVYSAVTTNKGE